MTSMIKLMIALLLSLPIMLNAQANLELVSAEILNEQPVKIGDFIQFNLKITNSGDQVANHSIANLYVSAQQTITFFHVPMSVKVKALQPGETVDIPVLYYLPTETTFGSYYVVVRLDVNADIEEQDEQNQYLLEDQVEISYAQVSYTKLPYPIILVHGWVGSATNWENLMNYYIDNYGLIYGGQLPFCLNMSDGTHADEDIKYFPQVLVPGDFYIVNFDVSRRGELNASDDGIFLNDVLSNQAAIHKQGIALRTAINEVLWRTGADKVILTGHSMGGLSIRQYLQNPQNWQFDGKHHVGKVLTVGTPNGGNNINMHLVSPILELVLDHDDESDAMRDMRYKSEAFNASFLDGGWEKDEWIFYKNRDVNCDGDEDDYVIGLNQKYAPTDIEYSSVVGTGTDSHWGFGEVDGDGVVRADKADLKDFLNFRDNAYDLFLESFYTYNSDGGFFYHSNLIKESQYFEQIINGQDESEFFVTAPTLELGFIYQGTITEQGRGSYVRYNNDIDSYHFYVPQESNITISLMNIPVYDCGIQLFNESYDLLDEYFVSNHNAIQKEYRLKSGHYYVDINAEIADGATSVWKRPYYIAITQSEVEVNDNELQVLINADFIGDCDELKYRYSVEAVSGNANDFNWSFDGADVESSQEATVIVTYDQAGVYDFGIQYGNGVITKYYSDSINVRAKDMPVIEDIILTEDRCGYGLGAASVLMATGNNNFDFNWSIGSQEAHINKLAKGNYFVTISNTDGCSIEKEIVIEGAEKYKALVEVQPITCHGANDGVLIPSAEGGTPPYTFELNNNDLNPTFENLGPGKYLVNVTDANGCTTSINKDLTDPSEIIGNVEFKTINGKTESFLEVIGGVSPYKIVWSNGATGNNNPNPVEGEQSLTITDALECTKTIHFSMNTTSTKELIVEQFSIYPNPTRRTLNLNLQLHSFQKVDFTIFNALGEKVKNWSNSGAEFNEVIDLHNWSTGSYWLQVSNEKGILYKKFIKI